MGNNLILRLRSGTLSACGPLFLCYCVLSLEQVDSFRTCFKLSMPHFIRQRGVVFHATSHCSSRLHCSTHAALHPLLLLCCASVAKLQYSAFLCYCVVVRILSQIIVR